jgi:dolichyl-phosphate-mannose--protein O-mannosyl transferase
MLDGVFQFFVFLTIWGLLRFWDQTKRRARNSGFLSFVLIGGALGATLSVKYSGAFLLVGLVFLVIGQGKKWLPIFRSLGVVMASALVVFVSVWVTHLTIGSKVQVALKDKGRYIASERTIASDSQEFHPSAGAYLSGLKDNLRYFSVYSAGIPKLDFRKSDENGSPAIIWPLAGKGINYRWDREGSYTSYLQLQGNPIVYWLGIAGLIFGIVYLFLPLFLERGKLDLNQTKRVQIAVLALLYLAYMTPMWMANRVLFLYTYFPALGISLLLLGAVFSEMAVFKSLVGRRATICAAVALVTVMFVFFSPLTYHQPLSPSELESRAWFKLWDLHCSSCERSFSWIGN